MTVLRRDCLIVGGGPAGCVAALTHAAKGQRVVVCEAKPKAAQRRLAGEWLHPAGADVLRRLGIDLPGAHAGRGFVVHTDDGKAPITLPYADGSLGFSWHHHELVHHLRDVVDAHPNIELWRDARVESVGPGLAMVEWRGESVEVRTPRIIGVDGKNSVVRKSLQLEPEHEAISKMIGVTLEGVALQREEFGLVALGGPGPMMIYRVGPDAIRVCIDLPSSFDAPRSSFAAELAAAYAPALPEPLRPAFVRAVTEGNLQRVTNGVRIRSAYGEDHPRGQVALIGDAVGYYHPLTAVGMTNGMLDAEALAEAKTVKSYARRRARASRMSGMLGVALYDMFSATGPEAEQMRAALYRVWREEPEEGRKTMRYLAAQDERVGAFLGSFAKVVGEGTLGQRQRGAPSARALRVRRGVRFMARRSPWFVESLLRQRPAASRMLADENSPPPSAMARAKVEAPASLYERARGSFDRGAAYLEAQQAESGAWEGEVVWCAMLPAQYVIAHHAAGRPISAERRANLLKQFEVTRREDGTWGLHEVSGPYLFVTSLVYVAARLLGVSHDDPLIAPAREFIRECGGATHVPSWGKIWLTLAGVYEWEGVHAVIPEAWLLPKSLPIHPARWYCHTRMIYMAMATLYGRGFQAPVSATTRDIRREIFPEGYAKVDWKAHRSRARAEEVYAWPTMAMQGLNRVSALVDSMGLRRMRRRALDKLQRAINFELEHSNYSSISPVSGLLNVLALHAADPTNPKIERAWEGLHLWAWEDAEEGFRIAGARSASWDTGFALQSLGDRPGQEEAKRRAQVFLEKNQILVNFPNYEAFDRSPTRGGYCFGDGWHGWPVSDCTAEALLGMVESGAKVSKTRVRLAAEFILDRQNHDGGFGTYEARRTRSTLEWMNPAEIFGESTTEGSFPECTGSCVEALAAALPYLDGPLETRTRRVIELGAEFLRGAQRPDGAWPGNWGVGDVYGTWFGIRGLRAAGARPDDPAIRRATDFLLAQQRRDGGWGEAAESCFGDEVFAHEETQIVHTAWGLLGLLAAECPRWDAIEAAAQCLISAQRDDGNWPKQDPAGVFFRTALLDYRLYRSYFPVWAIGRYLSAAEARGAREGQTTEAQSGKRSSAA